MKKTIFSIITVAAVISCSKNLEPDIPDDNQQPIETIINSTYSVDEALANLNSFYESCGFMTKSPATINEIIAISNYPTAETKSTNSTDSLLYIVNYAGNNGFAVLAADRRIPTDILAVGEYGNLQEEDFIISASDSTFSLERLIMDYAAYSIGTIKDTVAGLEPYGPEEHPITQINDDYVYIEGEWASTHWGNWKTTDEVPAMLMTQWGQGSPYKDMTGAQYAGCGVTAVAQMLAYNQYPALLDDMRIPYDTLRKMRHVYTNSAFADDVAALFKHIFLGCKAKPYGEDGTLVWPKNIAPYLKELGYKNVDIYRHPSKCNNEIIYASLDKGYPVLITATTDNFHGHTWVIDGYMKQFRSGSSIGVKTGRNYGTKYEYRDLMHCNWGKSGENNGYYYAGIFESYEPAVIPTTKGESDGYYKSFYRIITYEIPEQHNL